MTRAIATWPTLAGRARLHRRLRRVPRAEVPDLDGGRLRDPRGRASSSEETYVEQGLYWAKAHRPILEYVVKTYKPDLPARRLPDDRRVPAPVPGPRDADAARRRGQPGLRRRRPRRRRRTAASPQREGFLRARLRGRRRDPDARPQPDGHEPDDLRRPRTTASRPQFLAIDASKVLVDLGPAVAAADLQLPPRDRRDDRQGQGLLGRRHRPDLPQPRRPRPGRRRGSSRSPAADEAATVAQIKAAYLGPGRPERLDPRRPARGLEGDRPGLHQGRGALHPERPGQHRRHGAPDADRRPRRVLVPAVPVRRRDAGHARVASSHFFGQHGYVPDVQDLAANVNMRATFLAGGTGIAKGTVTARTIDLAPTLAFILGVPEPQHSQGRVLLEVVKGGSSYKPISIIGLTDFHGQLDPTTLAYRRRSTRRSAGRRTWRRCSTRSSPACPGPGCSSPRATTSAPHRPNSGLLEDMPAIDVENAWGLDATSYGNHEFDYGVERLLAAPGPRRLPVPRHQHRRRRRPASCPTG